MNESLRHDLETLILDGPVCVVLKRPEIREDGRNVFAFKVTTAHAGAELAAQVEGRAANVYVVRNPSGAELRVGKGAARRASRAGEPGNPPLDGEVELLRWLPIDVDPVYPAGEHDPRAVEASARASTLGALDSLVLGIPLWYVLNSGRGTQAQIRLAEAAPATPENVALYRACARALYARLAEFVDATCNVDGSVLNPARQTRLVGTVNPRTGLRAEMLAEPHEEVASLAELARLLSINPAALEARPEGGGGDEGDLPIELLREILDALDVLEYATREDYLRMAFAVATACDKDEDAWELFDEWSAGDEDTYDEAGNRAIWESCRVEGGGVGVGTLIHELNRATHDRPDEAAELRALVARVAARSQEAPEFPDLPAAPPTATPTHVGPSVSEPTLCESDPLFDAAPPRPEEAPTLSLGTPLTSAEKFLALRPHLVLYREEWLEYDEGAYGTVAPSSLKAAVIAFLKRARCRIVTPDGPRVTPFPVARKPVGEVLDMLTGPAHLPDIEVEGVKREAPFWLTDAGPDPRSLIACRNGLLDITSGAVLPHTPRYFSRTALPYAYDPAASAPRWAQFLLDIFPADEPSRELLQEVFGYLVSTDTRHQVLFLLHGKSGSGKGTTIRVLEALVGGPNCTSPKISSLSKDFGLQPLIGKSLAIISDARIGPRTDSAALLENLLSISGEDRQSINRKNRPFWEGMLTTRIVVVTNRFPHLPDEAGALARRLIPLRFLQSFTGRADLDLTTTLLTELPGILNWALEGLRRLRARGHFELPATSRVDLSEMARESSPVSRFTEDELDFCAGATARKDEVYRAYVVWCTEQGERPLPGNSFGRELLELYGDRLKPGRGARQHGRQPTVYVGARLIEADTSTDTRGDPLDFPPIH